MMAVRSHPKWRPFPGDVLSSTMAFGGADFVPSRTPEASNALQLAAGRAVNAAARKSKNLREFTGNVKEIFEAANGVGWHVLAGSDFAVDLRYRKGACVLLSSKKSKLKVVLYRTTPATTAPVRPVIEVEPLSEESVASASKKRKDSKVVWFDSDMDNESKAQVVCYTKALLEQLKADAKAAVSLDTRLSQSLKQQLSFKYGNTWHVIVSTASRELCCLPYCDPQTYADFAVDTTTRVVVYRHNGVATDTQFDMTQFGYRATLTVAAMCFVVYSYFNYTGTELHEKCGATVEGMAEDESQALSRPEGCSETDVVLALAHKKWKTAAFIGLVVFSVVASFIRMFRRSLRQKLKHG